MPSVRNAEETRLGVFLRTARSLYGNTFRDLIREREKELPNSELPTEGGQEAKTGDLGSFSRQVLLRFFASAQNKHSHESSPRTRNSHPAML